MPFPHHPLLSSYLSRICHPFPMRCWEKRLGPSSVSPQCPRGIIKMMAVSSRDSRACGQEPLGSNDGSPTSLLGNLWAVPAPLWASLSNSRRKTTIIVLTEHSCSDKDRINTGQRLAVSLPARAQYVCSQPRGQQRSSRCVPGIVLLSCCVTSGAASSTVTE